MMPKFYSRNSLIFLNIFLLFLSFDSYADNVSEQLIKAEQIKSTHPIEFANLLEDIATNTVQLKPQQKYLLKYLQAYQLVFTGKAHSALPILETILSSDADKMIKLRCRITMVNFYAYDQNWTDGLSHLSKLLDTLPEIEDEELKQNGLALAAMFYNQIGQYSLGLKYAQNLEKIALKPRQICMAKMFKIEAIFNTSIKLTDPVLDDALDACKSEPIAENLIRSFVAETQINNGNFIEGKETLLKHIQAIESTKYVRLITRAYSLLSQSFFLEGDLKESERFALKAITLAKTMPTTRKVVESQKILYEIAKLNSSYELALQYNEKYIELKDIYTNKSSEKHLAFQLAEHNAYEQESQIQLLNEKNALLISEQALDKAKVANIQLMITILTVTLALLTLWGGRLWKAHKRVKELAEYDALTGIYNRGHFAQVTNSALKYCKNAEQELSVIMFDLDHFKKVSDSFGHACGDWALKATIKACQSIGRQNDIFARLGGEEFCLVLPSCNIAAAMLRAEACRAAIEEIITEESGCDFSITASFGVTDAKRSGFNLDKLLADADFAAYASKNSGRNRVTLFEVP
ncbi:GGDEF domain-containing protein [Colwellia sp. 12G3]|uniref:GGDEF domain-containing protein n=1 Tax=Colwellia sp. 12G3 TaxID=2058299 RepID=UPI000C348E1F|nr:GGDEF domain-containing protein [Colwellia sp. 12G3]PKI17352.1 GGDEF domain-containing protein [Colwellia sp. 12G3]